jgi:nitroreductase
MLDAIERRRSVRKYQGDPVDEKTLLEILDAAHQAPSGDNTQPWRFILVRSEETRAAIAIASHHQEWMRSAPVHIVCVADIRSRVKDGRLHYLDEKTPDFEVKQVIRDTAIAVDHLILEATARGLGSCWTAWYTQAEIRPLLGIPDDKFVVGIVTLGHAAEEPKARPRRPLEEILHRESWETR